MTNVICALNKIGLVDKLFFIICAVAIALIVAIYFLIPVFNKKFYKEQRENLRKRGAAFKTNLHPAVPEETEGEAKQSEEAKDSSET